MSTARRERREQGKHDKKASKGVVHHGTVSTVHSNKGRNTILTFLTGAAIGAGVLYAASFQKSQSQPAVPQAAVLIAKTPEIKLTIGNLMSMSEAELASVDIALVNLLCAESLPGRNGVSIEECLRSIDQMAEAAKQKTVQNFHRFVEKPSEYENSEIYYRVGMMVNTLGKDLGVQYNPEKIVVPTEENRSDLTFFDKADDVFISGMMTAPRLGTCSSMPVLCVAVGRRLGYPLKLVSAKGHLFFRWDDGREKMNFECTNRLSVHNDDYYKKWPYPIFDEEVSRGWYLRSLSPKDELSVFLNMRGHTLVNHGRVTEALLANTQAALLYPSHPNVAGSLAITAAEQATRLGLLPAARTGDSDIVDPFAVSRELERMNRRQIDGTQPPNFILNSMQPQMPFFPTHPAQTFNR